MDIVAELNLCGYIYHMEDIKIKAYEYAEKINRVSDKTVLDFMSGYQACQQREIEEVLEEIKERLSESYVDPPQALIDALADVIEDFKLFNLEEDE